MYLIFTARKQSLRQGNFSQACVSHSVHGGGGFCMMPLPVWLPGPMFLPGEGVSVQKGGLCPGGSLSRVGSLSRGESLSGRHPRQRPPRTVTMVRILLECFLVHL